MRRGCISPLSAGNCAPLYDAALGVGPRKPHQRIGGRLAVEFDAHMAILPVFGRMHDGQDAAGISDGAAGEQVAHHTHKDVGGVERVFLQRFKRGDTLAIEIQAVIGLAEANVELMVSKGGENSVRKSPWACESDELVYLGQSLILVIVPELFDIGADAPVEEHLTAGFEMHPAGLHLHLLIARNHGVVGLHDGGDGEVAGEDLLAGGIESLHAISRGVGGGLFDLVEVIFSSGIFSLRASISSTG